MIYSWRCPQRVRAVGALRDGGQRVAERKLAVLVVDDENAMRVLLSAMLRAEGHTVFLASDGDTALAMVEKHSPDVAIVDMYMPGKDGVQTITNMRITHPGIGIVAMSGDTNSDVYLRAAASLGVRAGLQKPFSRQQVFEAIARVAGHA
jgi:CheY-like chemotaxis protein